MLYAILCKDYPRSADLRAEIRPKHLEYLARFDDNVVMVGPLLSDDGAVMIGSLLIMDFETLGDAEQFAANDPYKQADLFEQVFIYPYKKVLPKD